MSNSTQNTKIGMAAVVSLIAVIGGGMAFYQSQANRSGITFQDAPKTTTTAALPATPQNLPKETPKVSDASDDAGKTPENPTLPEPAVEEIVVHITGAVKSPGVYRLPAGARGKDAVEKAGGVLQGANSAALNLAAKLEDGSQLYIPTQKEEPKSPAEKEYLAGNLPIVLPKKPSESKTPNTIAGTKPSKSAANGGRGSRSGSGKLTDPSQGMVNINKAGDEELQKLPGIGPAMAARVIAYRQESGIFQTPEDLMQVSGIGEKKFAKMKPFVKVK